MPTCRDFGLGVLVWSPLARGFLSGKFRRGQAAPQGARLSLWRDSMRALDNDRCWATLDAVRAVATERSVSPAVVALAWLLTRPEVTSVILGARDGHQLAENLRAAELTLSAAEVARLDEECREINLGYPYSFIEAFSRR